MKRTIAVLFLIFGVARPEWLKTTIYVPDSLSGIKSAVRLVCDTAENRVLIADELDWVLILDAATNTKIARLPLPYGASDMLYVPELGRVYCASRTRSTIYVIDPAACAIVDSVRPPYPTVALAYNPSANKLYCSSGVNRFISVVDCAQDSFTDYIQLRAAVGQMCIVPDVNKLYCLQVDSGQIAAISCMSDSVLRYIDVGVEPRQLLYNSASAKLYCSVHGADSLAILDVADDRVIGMVGSVRSPTALGLNPVLNQVYCASALDSIAMIVCGQGDTLAGLLSLPLPALDFICIWRDSLVFAYDRRGRLLVIDCSNNTCIDSFYAGRGYTRYDPKVERIYCTGGNQMLVFGAVTRTLVDRVLLGVSPSGVSWCSEGNKLYCAGGNVAATAVIDCATNSVTGFIQTPAAPSQLLYNPLRNKMYVANLGYQESTLTVIDCYGDTVVARVSAGPRIMDMCYVAGYDEVYVAGGPDVEWAVYAIDGATDSVEARLEMRQYPLALASSGRNKAVYCACWWTDYVQVIDCATHQIKADISVPGRPVALEYWPDGNLMFVALLDSDQVAAIDCGTNQVVARIPAGNEPNRLILADHGREIYCANRGSDNVTVIDCATLVPMATIAVCSWPTTLQYDSIADKVYCAGEDSRIVSVIDCIEHRAVAAVPVGRRTLFTAWNPVSRSFYASHSWSSSISVIRDTALSGATEPGSGHSSGGMSVASLVRNVLILPPTSGAGREARCVLLDVSGRKVAELHPGANDVRALAPGVYFVREAQAQAQALVVRKVIITR